METGAQLSVDTPVLSLLGADDPVPHADDRKRRITVGHLMTHSSGLACDDNDDDSPGNEGVMQSQDREPDWYRYALNLPMMHDPGTRYAYCTAGMNLVGWVVSRATGTWLPDFFRRHVAEPLQIERYHLNLMPTGEAYAGGGVYLTPRDFLKLGQAYLNGGVWNRRRLVSEEWVAQSTAHQIDASSNSSDGYAWHRYELPVGDRVYQEYEANGNGGQFLIVVPELDLVIVFTAGYYGMYGVWRRLRDEVVPQRILSAMHVP